MKRFDVDAYTQAWNSRDTGRVIEQFADNAELVTPDLPDGAHGKDELREVAADWFRTFPDMTMQVEKHLQEGDTVATMVRIQGTNKGDIEVAPGQRVPATGKRVDYRIAAFMTLDNSAKVRRLVAVFDNASIMEQLGISPEPTGAARTRPQSR
jgi:steroid delta-isomerase-like uncharacterized protein